MNMDRRYYYLTLLFVMATLSFPVLAIGQQDDQPRNTEPSGDGNDPQQRSRDNRNTPDDGRVYDRSRHDYHPWTDNEDRAFAVINNPLKQPTVDWPTVLSEHQQNWRDWRAKSQHNECHVIVLRRPGGKGDVRTKQALQQLRGVSGPRGLASAIIRSLPESSSEAFTALLIPSVKQAEYRRGG